MFLVFASLRSLADRFGRLAPRIGCRQFGRTSARSPIRHRHPCFALVVDFLPSF